MFTSVARSGQTERWFRSESTPFDTLIVLLKEKFEKVYFENSHQMTKKSEKNYPACRVNTSYSCIYKGKCIKSDKINT